MYKPKTVAGGRFNSRTKLSSNDPGAEGYKAFKPNGESRRGRKARVAEKVRFTKVVKAVDGKSMTDDIRSLRGARIGKRFRKVTSYESEMAH